MIWHMVVMVKNGGVKSEKFVIATPSGFGKVIRKVF
jgi:hypothetical protein